ncbi:MAG: FAD-dependent oxidoreductase [Flavonifractor plautii]
MKHVIVIGGGAAGCMAAVAAAQKGAAVTLLERNPKLGRKLYITGKGRCNVTNDCAAPEVLQNVPRNSRFLTSAVTRFPPEAVKAFFEGLGVPLKTERGNRVFPCSDKAADIIDALLLALRRSGVHIVQGLGPAPCDGRVRSSPAWRGSAALPRRGGGHRHRRGFLSADRLHR